MISQTNNSAVNAAYPADTKQNNVRVTKQNAELTQPNRLEELKASVDSGTYKVDLNALSEKIAESLL